MDAVNRVLGRSVRDLADEVDQALGRLAQARGLEAAATEALRLAQQDVARAQQEVAQARDALFEEHPDLRPDNQPGPTIQQETPMSQPQHVPEGLDPSKFDPEIIEVDDPNDSRYTAGAGVSSVPTGDGEPLPPIEWGEHDDV